MRWLAVVAVIGCGSSKPPPGPSVMQNIAPPTVDAAPLDAVAFEWGFPQPSGPMHAGQVGAPMPQVPAACTTGPAQTDDLNGDGKPDVRRVNVQSWGGHTLLECKQLDFDYDGRFDTTQVFDAAGNRVLVLDDYDFDGVPDAAVFTDPSTGASSTLRDADHDGIVDLVGP